MTEPDLQSILKSIIEESLDDTILSIEALQGGANSDTYKISCSLKGTVLVKQYRKRPGETRDRLGTEFNALSFLWANGIRDIPEPLAQYPEHAIGLYSFIEGEKLTPPQIITEDIERTALFVKSLHALRSIPQSPGHPVAAEACFTIQQYLDNVSTRIARLRNAAQEGNELDVFISRELEPAFDSVKEFVYRKAGAFKVDTGTELRADLRTLSQSDMGFQNIIKRPDGRLAFIDFEYFGLDDPCKLVNDFFLQPQVPLPEAFRQPFYDKVLPVYKDDEDFPIRLGLVFPILAVKWCLIVLNLFLFNTAQHNMYNKNNMETDRKVFHEKILETQALLHSLSEAQAKKSFPLNLLG